jgi:TPR repeat protein
MAFCHYRILFEPDISKGLFHMQLFRRFALSSVLCLGLVGGALAGFGSLSMSHACYPDCDMAQTPATYENMNADSLREQAEQGDKIAQFAYAAMLKEGTGGVEKDLFEAFGYFKSSAEKDYVPALMSVALAYEKGEGTPQDYEQAIKWWTKAADAGVSAAQYRLGQAYRMGDLGMDSRDLDKGISLLKQAGEKGNVYAQNMLAYMFSGEMEDEIEPNYAEAAYWADQYLQTIPHAGKYASTEVEQMMYGLLTYLYAVGGHGLEKDVKMAEAYGRRIVLPKNEQQTMSQSSFMRECLLDETMKEHDFCLIMSSLPNAQ